MPLEREVLPDQPDTQTTGCQFRSYESQRRCVDMQGPERLPEVAPKVLNNRFKDLSKEEFAEFRRLLAKFADA